MEGELGRGIERELTRAVVLPGSPGVFALALPTLLLDSSALGAYSLLSKVLVGEVLVDRALPG